MEKHFTKIIWGLVLVFININLGVFDVFPNFIGYGLIAIGLEGLSEKNPVYKKGCVPAVVLVVYSFITFFFPFQVNLQELSSSNAGVLLLSLCPMVLNLPVFYSICTGIYRDAETEENTELMRRSKTTWNFILFFTLLELLLMPFNFNFKESIMVPSIIIAIMLFIGLFMLVGILRIARSDLYKDKDDDMSIS